MALYPDEISPELLTYLQQFLLEERIQRFEQVLNLRTKHITVALENVSDLQNINAAIRSAEGFGLQELHIINNGTKFKPAKKIVQGSHRWVTIHQHKEEANNTLSCIRHLREKGYKIVATTPHEKVHTIRKLDITQPTALFFGQENEGITDLLKQEADEFVMIPMMGFTESFNISVAVAIMLFELTSRLRENEKINWQLTDEEKYRLRSLWTMKNIYKHDLVIKRFYSEMQEKKNA
jgi:tRNA (guanosine-2'-O-)-methyltransferase